MNSAEEDDKDWGSIHAGHIGLRCVRLRRWLTPSFMHNLVRPETVEKSE